MSQAEYEEWLKDFEANLERFQFQSKIKTLKIFNKKNAVRNDDAQPDQEKNMSVSEGRGNAR